MPITTVLFDLGGVVCRFLPERRLAALAAACDFSCDEIHRRIWDAGISAACDRGEFSAVEMFVEAQQQLGLRMDSEVFTAAWLTAFEPDSDVLRVIDLYRGRWRMGLLTDNSALLRDAMPQWYPEISRRLTPLLFSCDLGACKPGPAIFWRALERLGEYAARVLLVDDSTSAVEGARAAGLASVHFEDAARLNSQLGALA